MNASVTEFRRNALVALVDRAVSSAPVIDMHTHLYDPLLGHLLLWGIDELLVYHYLVAEAFRHLPTPYPQFWSLSKSRQAEIIWNALFVEHSPVSEACRGVLTTLHRLGLDARQRDLPAIRQWYQQWEAERFVNHCLDLAHVQRIYMANSPFDDEERRVWQQGFLRDERFVAALRVDLLFSNWPEAAQRLLDFGYEVGGDFSAHTLSEIRRFLADWSLRVQARYLMVSLPPEFLGTRDSDGSRLLEGAVLPHCRELGQPLALMLGVKRQVNPALQLAGDSVGRSELAPLQHLCNSFPNNRFLVTILARENQHELCVLARKFRNLHPFGCWWFTNVPSLIEEITRLRLELLGTSFTVQHSDARVLDQLIYKWDHTRRILAKILVDKYSDLASTTWEPTAAEIERDVRELLGGAFERFCQM